MRRWNGWGDDQNSKSLPDNARQYLQNVLGEGCALGEAGLKEVVATVPPSRLEGRLASLVTDAEVRVRHAAGQSFPDWLRMKSGRFGSFPDAVAFPETLEEVSSLIRWCTEEGVILIPYGGGTSVAGHINTPVSSRPVLVLSLAKMKQLEALDEDSQIATFGPGIPGPEVESLLNAKGYTLGHFPQSFELSTLGGWVATRSSGQQSMRYGRIEQMFAGGQLMTPVGPMDIPAVPASSAGPDLREMVLGSEGRMGVITRVKVRISRLPEEEKFVVAFFPDWRKAKSFTREIAQQKVNTSMVRVSNGLETTTQLALAGHPQLIGYLENYLSIRGARRDTKCMVTIGLTGTKEQVRSAEKSVKQLCQAQNGLMMGSGLGKRWAENRFKFPYLRDPLWSLGYAVDTLETAVNWSDIDEAMQSVEAALTRVDWPVMAFTHMSHIYAQGASLYTTYLFPCADTFDRTLARWTTLKTAASNAVSEVGGTISHQHGVGVDHAPWLSREKGPLGMKALEALCRTFDEQGLMNPGKLLLDHHE
jgi:alkyldihydroxyacetonephosphate synthase